MQKTILGSTRFTGVGLHSGKSASLLISPASAGTGIVFRREGVAIPARFDGVDHQPLCTFLTGPGGASISTIEHFMAAAWALGFDNLIVDVDGPEVPIMDGSALPFVRGLAGAGEQTLSVRRKTAKVVRAVEYREGKSVTRLLPSDGFSAWIRIEFEQRAIGRQEVSFDGSFEQFMSGFSMARTFCLKKDIDAMHAAGKALGGSLENAVVYDGDRILNPGGLRVEKEAVRHKMLDVVGDLALLGWHLEARFEGVRPGHRMTNMLLRKAFATGALVDASTGDALRRECPLPCVA